MVFADRLHADNVVAAPELLGSAGRIVPSAGISHDLTEAEEAMVVAFRRHFCIVAFDNQFYRPRS